MNKLIGKKGNLDQGLDCKKSLGHKIMMKNHNLILKVFNVWNKEKDKLKVASYLAEKYSILLSRDQLDAMIRKGRKLHKVDD